MGDVLVGLLDLGIGGSSKGGQSTLLVGDSVSELLGTLGLVLAHNLASLTRATDSLMVTLVLEAGSLGELALCPAHRLSELILGVLSIDGHLREKSLLHLLASVSIVLHVLGHGSTDGGNVGLARLHLLSNVGLDLVKEGEQTLAAFLALLEGIGGLGVEETRLHHVGRRDGLGVEHILARPSVMLREHSLLRRVCCDVHNAAADCQAAEENEGHTGAGRLRLSHHRSFTTCEAPM